MCLDTLLTRFIEWLTSTPRQHSRTFMHRELRLHAANLVILFLACVCYVTGIISHIVQFSDDLAFAAWGGIVMVIVCVKMVLVFVVIFYRTLRYKQFFTLGFTLCLGPAILTSSEWIVHSRLAYEAFDFSNLLLGLSAFMYYIAAVFYLIPESFFKDDLGDDDDAQPEFPLLQDELLTPPPYEQVVADQDHEGHDLPGQGHHGQSQGRGHPGQGHQGQGHQGQDHQGQGHQGQGQVQGHLGQGHQDQPPSYGSLDPASRTPPPPYSPPPQQPSQQSLPSSSPPTQSLQLSVTSKEAPGREAGEVEVKVGVEVGKEEV